jgi:hypothetical protein
MEHQEIVLDSDLWLQLQEASQHSKRSINELLSEAIIEYLHKPKTRKLPGFVGMLNSGISDTSERAEVILAEEIAPYLADEAQD